MSFNWTPSIRCEVHDGKAFLLKADLDRKKCDGNCSQCDTFLGVNPSQVGEAYFDGCCTKRIVTGSA